MVKTPPITLAAVLLLGACAGVPPAPATTPAQQFEAMTHRYLDEFTRYTPVNATQLGDHRWDVELDDTSEAGRTAALAFNRASLAALEKIDPAGLSPAQQVDWRILRNSLSYAIWGETELREWQWNPLIYTQLAGSAVFTLMARDFAPLEARLLHVTSRLEKIPGLLAQERANLAAARVPAVFAETAIKQNRGVMSVVSEFVEPHLNTLPPDRQARLKAAIAAAGAAVEQTQAWLENDLLPNAKGDFRLGQALYDRKLAFALDSPLSRAEIRARAETALTRIRAQMYAIARDVLRGRKDGPEAPVQPDAAQEQAVIAAALELSYVRHPERDQVVAEAKQTLAYATRFVAEHQLVTVPPDPVEIVLMPEFQRGVAVAYCDAPGPLDVGQKTFYTVAPLPEDWTDAQVRSFLREYNSHMIHEVTLHEAVPGHYLQIAHANRYPSLLRAVYASGTFVEGWAVYGEQVAVDAGYLDHDPLIKLTQLKLALRGVANAILDQGVHVDGMTREQAMALMTERTFQQEREAAGKWVRAQLSSAQLPVYFVGAQEFYDLRREAEERLGAAFKMKAYHDQVLSYGSPPLRFVRALMFGLPIQ